MKSTLLTLAIISVCSMIFLVTQTACKKESVVNNTTTTDTVFECNRTINGLWEGTQFETSTSITQPFNLSVKSDGTCTAENISPGTQKNFSYGTWTLTGNSMVFNMRCVYGYPSNIDLNQDFTGTYNSELGKITGTFQMQAPGGQQTSGSFMVTQTN